jgi:hypothetical protein
MDHDRTNDGSSIVMSFLSAEGINTQLVICKLHNPASHGGESCLERPKSNFVDFRTAEAEV